MSENSHVLVAYLRNIVLVFLFSQTDHSLMCDLKKILFRCSILQFSLQYSAISFMVVCCYKASDITL